MGALTAKLRVVPTDANARRPKKIRFAPGHRATPAIRNIGQQVSLLEDLYHKVLAMPWWRFFAYVTAVWLGTNFVFAGLYALEPGSIGNVAGFEEAFYFSVQTLATIGYGAMSPVTRYGHLVVVLEALVGTLAVALVVGVTFAKFARPTARVLFSEKIVVNVRDGVPHMVFRLANWRGNMVVEGQLRVFVLLMEKTREGDVIRTPRDVPLVRDRTALFALTWVPNTVRSGAARARSRSSASSVPRSISRSRASTTRLASRSTRGTCTGSKTSCGTPVTSTCSR